MGQTRPQVMAARQQLSSVLPGARPLPLHPLLPLSLTRAPLTLSHSLRPSTIKWPRQQRAFSLPKCQFLGNRAGTRAITAGCQLNANEQPGSDWRFKTRTHTHIRRTFIAVMSTISMDNWCKAQLQPAAGDLRADTLLPVWFWSRDTSIFPHRSYSVHENVLTYSSQLARKRQVVVALCFSDITNMESYVEIKEHVVPWNTALDYKCSKYHLTAHIHNGYLHLFGQIGFLWVKGISGIVLVFLNWWSCKRGKSQTKPAWDWITLAFCVLTNCKGEFSEIKKKNKSSVNIGTKSKLYKKHKKDRLGISLE